MSKKAAPDLSEPIIGWRQWNLDITPGHHRPSHTLAPFRLYSGYRPSTQPRTQWPPGEALRARCERRHRAPAQDCSCGLYALDKPPDLWDLSTEVFSHLATNGTVVVFGEVSLWGRVEVCENGYRAEYGYPKNLTLMMRQRWPGPRDCDPRWWAIHWDLSAYRVPMEFMCVEVRLRPPEWDPLAPPHGAG